jgi:hypothetical protein
MSFHIHQGTNQNHQLLERAFSSSINIGKADLHDRMLDDSHNNLILCYIKKFILDNLNVQKWRKHFKQENTIVLAYVMT